MPRLDAIRFDLLTALLDSWSLWNHVAGFYKPDPAPYRLALPEGAPPPAAQACALRPMVDDFLTDRIPPLNPPARQGTNP